MSLLYPVLSCRSSPFQCLARSSRFIRLRNHRDPTLLSRVTEGTCPSDVRCHNLLWLQAYKLMKLVGRESWLGDDQIPNRSLSLKVINRCQPSSDPSELSKHIGQGILMTDLTDQSIDRDVTSLTFV